ncbi:MAG: hypothetical protein J5614_05045 [Paludibacteraceae bacterium]|nr:hypothetical protein [Paludibacteraceae bacterium]
MKRIDLLDRRLNLLIQKRIGYGPRIDMKFYDLKCDLIIRTLQILFRDFKFTKNLVSPEENNVRKIEIVVEIDDSTKYIKTIKFQPLWDNDNRHEFLGWYLVR